MHPREIAVPAVFIAFQSAIRNHKSAIILSILFILSKNPGIAELRNDCLSFGPGTRRMPELVANRFAVFWDFYRRLGAARLLRRLSA